MVKRVRADLFVNDASVVRANRFGPAATKDPRGRVANVWDGTVALTRRLGNVELTSRNRALDSPENPTSVLAAVQWGIRRRIYMLGAPYRRHSPSLLPPMRPLGAQPKSTVYKGQPPWWDWIRT